MQKNLHSLCCLLFAVQSKEKSIRNFLHVKHAEKPSFYLLYKKYTEFSACKICRKTFILKKYTIFAACKTCTSFFMTSKHILTSSKNKQNYILLIYFVRKNYKIKDFTKQIAVDLIYEVNQKQLFAEPLAIDVFWDNLFTLKVGNYYRLTHSQKNVLALEALKNQLAHTLSQKESFAAYKHNIQQKVPFHQYQVTHLDQVWTIDLTVLNREVELLIIIDLATRKILGYSITFQAKNGEVLRGSVATTEQVIALIIQTISAYQAPSTLLSDKGAQFTANIFVKFLNEYNIKHEIAHVRGNQVHERINRSFKSILKAHLKTMGVSKLEGKAHQIIKDVVCYYNNKSNRMLGTSPNHVENALSTTYFQTKPIRAKTNSIIGQHIETWKANVISKYAGNWLQFFMDWQIQQDKDKQEIVQEVKNAAQYTINTLSNENSLLRQQITTLQQQLQSVKDVTDSIAYKQKIAEQRKLERMARKSNPLRDPLNEQALLLSLKSADLLKLSDFAKARIKLAIILMYTTGLRISNLLRISVIQLNMFINQKSIDLEIIKKSNRTVHTFYLAKPYEVFFIQVSSEVQLLLQGKDLNEPVFTCQRSNKLVSRELFNRQVNSVLKITGDLMKEHFTSHSFRVGFATHVAKVAGIRAAQLILAHESIKTTEVYLRDPMSPKDALKIYGAVAHTRKNIEFRKRSKGIRKHNKKI